MSAAPTDADLETLMATAVPAAAIDPAAALAALFTPEGRADPYPYYHALRAHAPVLPVADDLVIVTGYAELEQALRHPDLEVHDAAYNALHRPDIARLPSITLFADSMLMGRSPDHERVRRLVAHAFTPRRLAVMETYVERTARDLAARLVEETGEGGTADAMAHLAYPLPIHVIADLIGVPRQDRDWFRPQVAALGKVMDPLLTPEQLSAADRAATRLLDYFAQLVAERRRRPADDLVSALLAVRDHDENRLSERELLTNLALLFVAGFETTAGLLGNSLARLLSCDEGLAAVGTPAEADAYVDEVLRHDSPIQVTGRWAVRDTELAGVPLAAGANAMLLLGAANRDPRRFAEPDVFLPSRTAARPLSFGFGAHYCLGAPLARRETSVALRVWSELLPGLRAGGAATRGDWLTLRGYTELPVRLTEPPPTRGTRRP
ncbi:cytochrome P450 [Yinghuangia seranimata]|uniref:cytochrome P450 n=1 Tax=Yinghuangia seranimata TaxID=408067 RepID=UPI00248C663D|nr:cytochrome P450 [Yinghuangia seranimata]MDI2128350.1 cytochrome P450 [Yinghuangia seranimata]